MVRGFLLCVMIGASCTPSSGPEVDAEADGVSVESSETSEVAEVEALEEVTHAEPCIRVVPARIALSYDVRGVQSVALEVESCGEAPLVISEVAFGDDGDGQYQVSWDGEPVTVEPGATTNLIVRFVPSSEDALPPSGELIIRSNAPHSEVMIPIEAFGHGQECPVAVIEVVEGDEVLPQTNLHLDGSGSYGPAEIVGYEWRVLQPNGSLSTFWPSAEGAHVSFETNIVGPYVFSLTVTDARGERSCVAAEYTVVVTSDEAIRVDVSWQVPGDPDASDEVELGKPDVDLHFLHPLAEGRFYGEHDCYFANPNPEWGIFSPSDSPYLHVSDDGPESLRLDVPEQGVRYHVNAHYPDAAGQGAAWVTVRIYIYGVLRDQWTLSLEELDMWTSHTIAWPSGEVTRIGDGAPVIRTVMPLE